MRDWAWGEFPKNRYSKFEKFGWGFMGLYSDVMYSTIHPVYENVALSRDPFFGLPHLARMLRNSAQTAADIVFPPGIGYGASKLYDWVDQYGWPWRPFLRRLLGLGASRTPENKLGPAGYDAPGTAAGSEQRFIAADATGALGYRIEFWNDPDALVSTQDAIIEDVLDAGVFDLDTFEFTRVAFLRWDVPLPAGTGDFDETIDLRPDLNLMVDLKGSFDPQTGKVQWWFHGYDPDTGDYPADAMLGFLPPFDPETKYEFGWVEFNVGAKPGLPTGTRIENRAYVEFDFLGDLYDPPAPKGGPWVNTIDAAPPASRVEELPERVLGTSVVLGWAGEDDPGGAGLAHYDVYVSESDRPPTLWLRDTTETSAVFDGEAGRTYEFFSVATDNAGNREPPPDAQTTLMPTASLDVDDNGQADALTDGIVILRYLFGFRGAACGADPRAGRQANRRGRDRRYPR